MEAGLQGHSELDHSNQLVIGSRVARTRHSVTAARAVDRILMGKRLGRNTGNSRLTHRQNKIHTCGCLQRVDRTTEAASLIWWKAPLAILGK